MRTKEEHLNANSNKIGGIDYYYSSEIHPAMDSFAKEVAIEFGELEAIYKMGLYF